ncbi:hypothetical protein HYC85_007835 [Camellia sinensis]|uniref:histidine kinase n=1 Tax=Camellia sinensis TaxID=4442 RepID=A0A7J7HQQ1_CAMSI|nr:hypothetical protein HYC85_007835 [Camellia sinensis]
MGDVLRGLGEDGGCTSKPDIYLCWAVAHPIWEYHFQLLGELNMGGVKADGGDASVKVMQELTTFEIERNDLVKCLAELEWIERCFLIQFTFTQFLNLCTNRKIVQNVLRARESGKGVLTAPFRLLKSNRLGVILTFAVYKTDLPSNATSSERIQATNGYLGGVFDIESNVEKLLQQLASKQTILVNVYDTTNFSHPISMYGLNVSNDRLQHVSTLNFGDPFRKHEMRCRFKQKPPWPWFAMMISIGILVIALLLGHIINATVNQIAKVEDDYHEMMELKKRAEAADVAKSQFLATVSHEIRTPMNGVLGMLQMLMDTDLDVTQQDYVRTAQGSGRALIFALLLERHFLRLNGLCELSVCKNTGRVYSTLEHLFSRSSGLSLSGHSCARALGVRVCRSLIRRTLLEEHLITAASNCDFGNAAGRMSGRRRDGRRGRPRRQEMSIPDNISAQDKGVGQANVVKPVGQ